MKDLELRAEMLKSILFNFGQMKQWIRLHNFSNVLENETSANSLITFMEVQDCGSKGGFDKESPCCKISGYKLYDRFLALVNKYETDICVDKIIILSNYFEKIGKK